MNAQQLPLLSFTSTLLHPGIRLTPQPRPRLRSSRRPTLARKELGQKERVWDERKNRKLVGEMDRNGNGLVEQGEFVDHFGEALGLESEVAP